MAKGSAWQSPGPGQIKLSGYSKFMLDPTRLLDYPAGYSGREGHSTAGQCPVTVALVKDSRRWEWGGKQGQEGGDTSQL